jgi:phosphoribosylamine--glycine ligase
LLYAGLALTSRGIRVVEFNARFGDPETQAIMPLLEGDLLGTMAAAASGSLDGHSLSPSDEAAVTVVVAAGDYPAGSDSGSPIVGIEDAEGTGALVFHAGTALRGDRVVTNGGRILGVTAVGSTVGDARRKAYDAAALISFPGARYRTDIAEEVERVHG